MSAPAGASEPPTPPARPITDDEVSAFRRDGVVCLRAVMPLSWIAAMEAPVEAALHSTAATDLSAMGDALARDGGVGRLVDEQVVARALPRGRFIGGTDHWRVQPEFLDFALRSPLAAIVARLLGSTHVWFYEDSVLVKEPGTQERTSFHQDMAYFHLAGDLVATTWVPLDPVTAQTGAVRYVIGSHEDRRRYRPNLFVADLDFGDDSAAHVTDYDRQGAAGSARIVSFDTEPGDVIVHHARTIHGASGNASATLRRRAISVRYAGDGTTFAPVAGLEKPHHATMVAGQPLDPEACPLAWPR